MGSLKEFPVITHPIIKNAIGQFFPEFTDQTTDTREEDEQEGRQKEKKKHDED